MEFTPLKYSHLKGDLHMHSEHSDGYLSIRDIVESTIEELSYEYIAITDHSYNFKSGEKIDHKAINEQRKIIRELQNKFPELHIFLGLECDLDLNGNPDFPEEHLRQFDFIICSIHDYFEFDQTQRLINAIRNPLISIIGHPKDPLYHPISRLDFNEDMVFQEAAAHPTVFEINAKSSKNLNIAECQKAVDLGIKFAINSDAHCTGDLYNLGTGVLTAQQCRLFKEDIINTLSADQLLKILKRKLTN